MMYASQHTYFPGFLELGSRNKIDIFGNSLTQATRLCGESRPIKTRMKRKIISLKVPSLVAFKPCPIQAGGMCNTHEYKRPAEKGIVRWRVG